MSRPCFSPVCKERFFQRERRHIWIDFWLILLNLVVDISFKSSTPEIEAYEDINEPKFSNEHPLSVIFWIVYPEILADRKITNGFREVELRFY